MNAKTLLHDRSRWQSAALSVSFVMATMSGIAYQRVILVPWPFHPGEPQATLMLILLVQVLPTAVVYVADRLIALVSNGSAFRVWRRFIVIMALVGVVSLLLTVPQITNPDSPPPALPRPVMLGIYVVGAMLGLFAYHYAREFITYVALGSILFVGYFLYHIDFVGSVQRQLTPPVIPDHSIMLPGPVVIVLLDELSYDALLTDGRIDQEQFPNIAALAADGVEFTNAFSNHSYTRFSVPSMMSGRLLLASWDRQTVHEASILGRLALHVRVVAYQEFLRDCLTAYASCHSGFQGRPLAYALAHSLFVGGWTPPGFVPLGRSVLWPDFDGSLYSDYRGQLLRELESPDAAQTIFFYQSMLTHHPYFRDESGQVRYTAHLAFYSHKDFDLVWAAYREYIRYADHRFGELVQRLKTIGLYDRATIVLVSDHGIRPYVRTNGRDLLNEFTPLTPHVPLIIKAPGLAPGRSDVAYQHVDFIPTLFDVLNIEWPDPFEGVSAFTLERPKRDRVFYYGEPRPEDRWVYDEVTERWQRKPD